MNIEYQERIGNYDILKQLAETEFRLDDCRLKGSPTFLGLAYDQGKLIGRIVASVYSTNSTTRFSQWTFIENRFRSCWIDRIDVLDEYCSKGIGSELLRRAENFFQTVELPENARKNMYVVSLNSAIPFYLKAGYQPIDTPESEEDDDVGTFMNEVGIWMAKPLNLGLLDSEVNYLNGLSLGSQLLVKLEYGYSDDSIFEDASYDACMVQINKDYGSDYEDQINGTISQVVCRYPLKTLQRIVQKIRDAFERFEKQRNLSPSFPKIYLYEKHVRENREADTILAWLPTVLTFEFE